MRKRRRRAIALVGAALLAGCARVGVEPHPASVAPAQEPAAARATDVVFGGTVTLGSQRLPVLLELRGAGEARQHATLRIPDVPMEAIGEGSWSGDLIRLELRYGDRCPGTVAVRARVTDRGAEGTLEARDCTGKDTGTLILQRRTTASPER